MGCANGLEAVRYIFQSNIYFVEEMIVLRYHVPNYYIILSSTREIDLGDTEDR